MNNYNYYYDEYYYDVATLAQRYKKITWPHIVSVYRGSLPLGVHLSNILKLPEFDKNPDYSLMALFGNDNDDGVHFLHEQMYRWIVFPWERVPGQKMKGDM